MNWMNENLMPVLPEIVLLKALFIIFKEKPHVVIR